MRRDHLRLLREVLRNQVVTIHERLAHHLVRAVGVPMAHFDPVARISSQVIFEATTTLAILLQLIDRTVFIPRIVFFPQDGEYPFSWSRRQFPVKPAFATTINKAQGKTLLFN